MIFEVLVVDCAGALPSFFFYDRDEEPGDFDVVGSQLRSESSQIKFFSSLVATIHAGRNWTKSTIVREKRTAPQQ